MKKSIKSPLIVCAISATLISCNANNLQKGAGIGAGAGALLGAIIGDGEGALIGAAIGGAAGAAIGNHMDKQARDIEQSIPGAQVERYGDSIKVTLNENTVNFDFDSATLTPLAESNLYQISQVFNQYTDTNIAIVGFTDSKGSDEYNLKLSQDRAASVTNFLINKGVAGYRLAQSGLGEANPVADNNTEIGRAANRRVEFNISPNQQMINEAQQATNS